MKKTLSLLAILGIFICLTMIPVFSASADETSTTDISTVSTTELSEKSNPSEDSSVSEESTTSETSNPIEPVYGDANGDGAINMKDILMIRKYMAHLETPTIIESQADANGDQQINMKDILMIRKYMAHIIDHLGPNIQDPKYTYYDNGNVETKSVYNGQDLLAKKYFYDIDGNLDRIEAYTYNEEGVIIGQFFYDSEEVLTLSWEFTYYEDGSMDILFTELANQTYCIEKYDPSHNLIEETKQDSTDRILYHNQYTYNEKGNCLSEICYGEEGVFEYHYVWEYDENGEETSQFEYDENGELILKRFYYFSSSTSTADQYYAVEEYDSNDCLVSQYIDEIYYEENTREVSTQTSFSADGILSEKTITLFINDIEVSEEYTQYDEEGNILNSIISTYNESENILSEKIYDLNQLLIKEILYTYNEDDLISITTNTYEDGILVDSQTQNIEPLPEEEIE